MSLRSIKVRNKESTAYGVEWAEGGLLGEECYDVLSCLLPIVVIIIMLYL